MNRAYGQLFRTFLKIGAFTFGGGYAMIPMIQREAGEKQGWISDDDLIEIVAIAESTPGPIAINAATFIGSRVAGVKGSLCATAGVILPSIVIISVIASVLEQFGQMKQVQWAFFGIRAGVLALIVKTFVNLARKQAASAVSIAVMAAAFAAVGLLKINALWVLLCAMVFGLLRAVFNNGRNDAK